MHDPRVGRFFAVDPLAPKYPHNSPYAFSENRVIDMVELEGLEASYEVEFLKTGRTVITITVELNLIDGTQKYANFKSFKTHIENDAPINFYAEDKTTNTVYMMNIVYSNKATLTGLLLSKKDYNKFYHVFGNRTSVGFTYPGNTQIGFFAFSFDTINSMSRTAQHELGHMLGLHHPKNEKDKNGNIIDKGHPKSVVDLNNFKITPKLLMRQSKYTQGKDVLLAEMKAIVTQISIDKNLYTIIKGDTLSSIAKRFNTTVKKLAKINNIKNVHKIKAGDEIKIR